MTTVLKLGGSVITDKAAHETIDTDRLTAVTEAIGATDLDQLVLVHGGGSFGHPAAAEHAVSPTTGTTNIEAILSIHRAMDRLNRVVVDQLVETGVAAVPVSPLAMAARDQSGVLSLGLDAVHGLLGEGLVPVFHGDIIVHRGRGATIVSGDELVVALGQELDADRIGLCSNVPGVLNTAGAVIPSIDRYEQVADAIGDGDGTDVTGGMAGKVQSLLAVSIPAWIFGPADLTAFLKGGSPGTRIGSAPD